ncbi:hypothetical protein HanRHA438_Chr10g0471591 [Helianthus annuus]|nr:hypothetical protein HanRHA438_Chr10g0471591 [Helianthus annuus]
MPLPPFAYPISLHLHILYPSIIGRYHHYASLLTRTTRDGQRPRVGHYSP